MAFCKEDIADFATIASRYTRVIKLHIRNWPEERFWLHNRCKNGANICT